MLHDDECGLGDIGEEPTVGSSSSSSATGNYKRLVQTFVSQALSALRSCAAVHAGRCPVETVLLLDEAASLGRNERIVQDLGESAQGIRVRGSASRSSSSNPSPVTAARRQTRYSTSSRTRSSSPAPTSTRPASSRSRWAPARRRSRSPRVEQRGRTPARRARARPAQAAHHTRRAPALDRPRDGGPRDSRRRADGLSQQRRLRDLRGAHARNDVARCRTDAHGAIGCPPRDQEPDTTEGLERPGSPRRHGGRAGEGENGRRLRSRGLLEARNRPYPAETPPSTTRPHPRATRGCGRFPFMAQVSTWAFEPGSPGCAVTQRAKRSGALSCSAHPWAVRRGSKGPRPLTRGGAARSVPRFHGSTAGKYIPTVLVGDPRRRPTCGLCRTSPQARPTRTRARGDRSAHVVYSAGTKEARQPNRIAAPQEHNSLM